VIVTMATSGLHIERTVIIQAPPARVLRAFFEPNDLAVWWQVVRSVTVPRSLGMYAVEWPSTEYRDELLGQLGGAFHGTVMEFQPGSELFIADAYWQPPDGEPIGPMALEVRCSAQGGPNVTKLIVQQRGQDEGPRWQRYFEVVAAGWQRALADLKQYLDDEHLRSRTR
jgi:uncharacterized protein YndB with AHSA1/START domain